MSYNGSNYHSARETPTPASYTSESATPSRHHDSGAHSSSHYSSGQNSASDNQRSPKSSTSSTPNAVTYEEKLYWQRWQLLDERWQTVQFRLESDIRKFYFLGEEVVPPEGDWAMSMGWPGPDGMKDGFRLLKEKNKAVVYGKRVWDKKTVVIKWRNKVKSFKDDQEVIDWIRNMKQLWSLTSD